MSNAQQIYSTFIPAGSYTSTTLAAAIIIALNGLSIPSGEPSPISWVCSFTGGVFDIGQNNAYPSGAANYRFSLGEVVPMLLGVLLFSLGWTAQPIRDILQTLVPIPTTRLLPMFQGNRFCPAQPLFDISKDFLRGSGRGQRRLSLLGWRMLLATRSMRPISIVSQVSMDAIRVLTQ